MGVFAAKRVKCPCNHVYSLRKHTLTLRQLKTLAEMRPAMIGFYGEHVRVMGCLAVFNRRETVDKASENVIVKSANKDTSGCLGGHEMRERDDVEIGNAPDLPLQVFYRMQLGGRFDIAD